MCSINQKEYLKRYLSNDGKKKKKSKHKLPQTNKIRIVEDVLDLHTIQPEGLIPSDEEFGEDAPQVAEVIDERPDHIKQEELFRSNKWRAIDASNTGTREDENIRMAEGKYSAKVTPTVRYPQRHDSDSDLSPDRERSRTNRLLQKPMHDSDPDLSPPRSRRDKLSSKQGSRDAGSGLSSRRQSQDSDPDLAPPRPKKGIQHLRRSGSDLDLSPPRAKSTKLDMFQKERNLSGLPSDKTKHVRDKRGSTRSASGSTSQKASGKVSSTLAGLRAGLQDSSHLRKELEEIKMKENYFLEQIGDEVFGRRAETVFRDKKTGKRRDLKEERRKQREEEQQKAEQQEKYMEWGKGLKQSENQAKQLEDDLYEMSKPFARYSDDVDLENHLKEQEREGDPMLEYIKKRKIKEKGEAAVRPVYQGAPPPPNRFNIMPGYRWDGVDRSNGFEAKYFKQQANKQAISDEAYKWSTQDM